MQEKIGEDHFSVSTTGEFNEGYSADRIRFHTVQEQKFFLGEGEGIFRKDELSCMCQ